MRNRTLAVAGVVLTGVGLAGLVVPVAAAGADTGTHTAETVGSLPSSFEVSAVADGVRVSTTVPGAPLSDGLVDVSTATTQAVVDAVGVSRSFAAVPYPGATLTNLPDVLRGASGAPIPTYPLIAAADHPTNPEATASSPAAFLQARSQAGRSEATLTGGAGSGNGDDATAAGRTTGHSLVTAAPDGSLSAEATSSVAALSVGPLHIARVTSLARVVRAGSGEPRREQSLEVTGLNVAGQALGIGPAGLVAGSGNVPLPDSHPVRAALEQAGIAVRYLEPVDTPDGALSAGLLISQVIPASPTGQTSHVTYMVGRAGAQIVVGSVVAPAPGPDTASSGLPAPPPGDSSARPNQPALFDAAAFTTSPSAAPIEATDQSNSLAGVGALDLPSADPSDAHTSASGDPVPVQTLPAAAPAATTVPLRRAVEVWSDGFFAALAAAGLLVLLLFVAVRSMGVKSIWVS